MLIIVHAGNVGDNDNDNNDVTWIEKYTIKSVDWRKLTPNQMCV